MLCLQLRGKAEVKELPSPLTILQPLRRDELLRYAQVYLALSRQTFLNLKWLNSARDFKLNLIEFDRKI